MKDFPTLSHCSLLCWQVMVHWLQARLYVLCMLSMFTPTHPSAGSLTRWHMSSSSETQGAKNDSVFVGSQRTQAALTCVGWHPERFTCWWRDQGVSCTAPDPVSRGHNFLQILAKPHLVNTFPMGLQSVPGSQHQSGSIYHKPLNTVSVPSWPARKRMRYRYEKIPDIGTHNTLS